MTEVRMDWTNHEWRGTLPNGEVLVGGSDWLAAHDLVKRHVPDVKFTYTPSGWQQNVIEFERNRHWR